MRQTRTGVLHGDSVIFQSFHAVPKGTAPCASRAARQSAPAPPFGRRASPVPPRRAARRRPARQPARAASTAIQRFSSPSTPSLRGGKEKFNTPFFLLYRTGRHTQRHRPRAATSTRFPTSLGERSDAAARGKQHNQRTWRFSNPSLRPLWGRPSARRARSLRSNRQRRSHRNAATTRRAQNAFERTLARPCGTSQKRFKRFHFYAVSFRASQRRRKHRRQQRTYEPHTPRPLISLCQK